MRNTLRPPRQQSEGATVLNRTYEDVSQNACGLDAVRGFPRSTRATRVAKTLPSPPVVLCLRELLGYEMQKSRFDQRRSGTDKDRGLCDSCRALGKRVTL
jgi:hypothetical protein